MSSVTIIDIVAVPSESLINSIPSFRDAVSDSNMSSAIWFCPITLPSSAGADFFLGKHRDAP